MWNRCITQYNNTIQTVVFFQILNAFFERLNKTQQKCGKIDLLIYRLDFRYERIYGHPAVADFMVRHTLDWQWHHAVG